MRAENLYSSELFYKSRRYAQANFDAWMILSAKHGLVRPSEVIAPYDLKLTTLSRPERAVLAQRVSSQVATLLDPSDRVTSICGEEYDELLCDAGVRFERKCEFALPIGKKLQALDTATDPEKSQRVLDAAYKIIGRLSKNMEGRRLRNIVGGEMPPSGIYLFLDEAEPRLKQIDQLRIVRVGTHGVAAGSKASLKNRMRTHYGTAMGEGNHRSSIFRLHTGQSLMNASRAPSVSTWGTPTADKEALAAERDLERAVSNYLANLCVLLVAVPGEADKGNDRAYLEQNLIALLSNGCRPLDPPSSEWLGLRSAKRQIRKSGLWNVNHVDQQFDPGFLDVLDHYVSVTIGAKAIPEKQLAPLDWQSRLRHSARQLALL
ncbi:MAG: hypothetical protein KF889_00215 [Alphaproteobacteria bacterium]|nr:hypothetical protein [Alphaproteobacteria bacterium]MCW5743250.1 hypothetical protein [Alphaproteobacteria bacterium]